MIDFRAKNKVKSLDALVMLRKQGMISHSEWKYLVEKYDITAEEYKKMFDDVADFYIDTDGFYAIAELLTMIDKTSSMKKLDKLLEDCHGYKVDNIKYRKKYTGDLLIAFLVNHETDLARRLEKYGCDREIETWPNGESMEVMTYRVIPDFIPNYENRWNTGAFTYKKIV